MPKESQRRVTIEDVAREAGVSPMTVSRVMNNTGRISEETRLSVREVADKLGYRPNRAARTLVTNRTFMVGCIVPDITNPYFAEILQGAQDIFWDEGYNVLLVNTNEKPEREKSVLSQLDDSTVDGIIVCSSRLSQDELIPSIKKHRAVVTINRPVPQELASAVTSEREHGYRAVRAARYLYQTGRRNIAYLRLLRGSSSFGSYNFTADLAEEGIEIKSEWVQQCKPTWKGGYEEGYKLLRANSGIDALIGGNDLVALGAMRAAIELGRRIPEDLAVIGADDILMASQVTPPLTTFRIDRYKVGAMAAHLLMLRMQNDMTYREYIYTEELVIRGTT